MNVQIEIDIWKGDWGLPSVDLNCLRVLAYCKFSGVHYQTKVTNNPFRSPNGKLPVFRYGKNELKDFQGISSYLIRKHFDLDSVLSPKQKADVFAYSQLLKEKLFPAVQFMWWIDQKNYIELTRPWYAKALPFPLNYYYPGKYEREAKELLENLYDQCDDLMIIESAVYGMAEKCLSTLSIRLGENDFFFGSRPSSLDATVYAYLAPLLKAPFLVPVVKNQINGYPNLVKFVSKITQNHFSDSLREYESKKSSEANTSSKKEVDCEFPHKRRNQFLAGLFATAVMTCYALTTGLVQVKVKDNDSDAQMNEYDEVFDTSEESDE